MSSMSKLCQIVYHSTCLDRTNVFELLIGYSGSKDNYHKQNKRSIWKRLLQYIAKNWWRHFWHAIFWRSKNRTRKLMTYLESRGNSEQETCAFYVKLLIWRLTWPCPNPGLTSIKSQIGWRHRAKGLSPSISECKMTQKKCVARHVCDLFYSDLLWPDLDLDIFKYALHAHAASFVDIYPALWVSVISLQPV